MHGIRNGTLRCKHAGLQQKQRLITVYCVRLGNGNGEIVGFSFLQAVFRRAYARDSHGCITG